jgi:type IV pilus assembly protein PilO
MALTMGKFPAWGQPVAALVVAAGLFLAEYKLPPGNFSEKQAQIEELQQQLDSKQQEIRKGEIALAKLEELQRDIAALEVKLGELKQILPTAPEMGDLLKWIKSLADQTNLELQVFKPEALADQEFLREAPVTMEVIGNYHQLGLFFDRISKYARIINVENVRMTPNGDRTIRATIRANFVAKTFIYKDDKGGDKAGGGA